jgi:hypothetical protein
VPVPSHNELAVTWGLSPGWPGMHAELPQASTHSGLFRCQKQGLITDHELSDWEE